VPGVAPVLTTVPRLDQVIREPVRVVRDIEALDVGTVQQARNRAGECGPSGHGHVGDLRAQARGGLGSQHLCVGGDRAGGRGERGRGFREDRRRGLLHQHAQRLRREAQVVTGDDHGPGLRIAQDRADAIPPGRSGIDAGDVRFRCIRGDRTRGERSRSEHSRVSIRDERGVELRVQLDRPER
jgi:hypothetical protein